MLEYLFEDTEAVGISMSEKEFYIGTMGGYWAVFSNYPKYDAFYFRDSQGMYEQDILDFLLTKLSLPLDLAQDCLSIMRKYDKLY
jgi:hypothetical protein